MIKPSAAYVKLQAKRRHLIEEEPQHSWGGSDFDELEAKFMSAWKLTPDRHEQARGLCGAIGGLVLGLEHCTFYRDAAGDRVIVAQPYGNFADDLKADLDLGGPMKAEVTEANAWGFYYPQFASLIVLKFPKGYAQAWAKHQVERRKNSAAPPPAEAPIEVPIVIAPAKAKPRKITRRPIKLPAGRQRG